MLFTMLLFPIFLVTIAVTYNIGKNNILSINNVIYGTKLWVKLQILYFDNR